MYLCFIIDNLFIFNNNMNDNNSFNNSIPPKHKESSNSMRGYSSVLFLPTSQEPEDKSLYSKEKEISSLFIKEKGLINEDLLYRIENASPYISNKNKVSNHNNNTHVENFCLKSESNSPVLSKDQFKRKKEDKESDKKCIKSVNKSFDLNSTMTNYEELAKAFENSKNFHPRYLHRGSDQTHTPVKRISISDYYNGIGIIPNNKDKRDSLHSYFKMFDNEYNSNKGIFEGSSNSPLMIWKDKKEFLKERQRELSLNNDFNSFSLQTPKREIFKNIKKLLEDNNEIAELKEVVEEVPQEDTIPNNNSNKNNSEDNMKNEKFVIHNNYTNYMTNNFMFSNGNGNSCYNNMPSISNVPFNMSNHQYNQNNNLMFNNNNFNQNNFQPPINNYFNNQNYQPQNYQQQYYQYSKYNQYQNTNHNIPSHNIQNMTKGKNRKIFYYSYSYSRQ